MRKSNILPIIAASLLIFTFIFAAQSVKAQGEGAYTVEWVSHEVKVMHNGYILINDTMKFSGQPPSSLLLGLPSKYASYLLDYAAYDASNTSARYPMTAGTPIEGHPSLFGFKVDFPQGAPRSLTVTFILSNALLRINAQNLELYLLDFPMYPSLPVKALSCNSTVILPSNVMFVNGTVEALKYSKTNLEAFTDAPGNLTFSYAGDEIQLFNVKELRREISVDGVGAIRVSDTYRITNISPKRMSAVLVTVPTKAYDVAARDEFGRKQSITQLPGKEYCYRVTLILPVNSNGSSIFMLTYALPKAPYLTGEDPLKLTLPNFENLNMYVEAFQLDLTLPEGAKVEAVNVAETQYALQRSLFQDKVSLTLHGLSFLKDLNVEVAYHYNVLWLSFRPTLWVWVAAVFGCVIAAAARRRPKTQAPPRLQTVSVPIAGETVQKFLELYEEKQRIISDIKALDEAVWKGRIPRRKYKVQRKTLEVRLNSITGNVEELKRKLLVAGGVYADLMRQLDAAEAEIEEMEAATRRIAARHRRGELSLEAYRRLLEEYRRRREDAEAKISGILVRLREELP